jgi:predicted HTH domain antitoxin
MTRLSWVPTERTYRRRRGPVCFGRHSGARRLNGRYRTHGRMAAPPGATLGRVKSLVLEIGPDVLEAIRLPPDRVADELRREFAVFLVREGLLPRAKARQLAAMERIEFDDLLARRGVAWEGTVDDVLQDVEDARQALLEEPPH